MKLSDIKNLPNEFDFKSNINQLVPLYHAVEEPHGYRVTVADGEGFGWNYTKTEFHELLKNGKFVVVETRGE